VAKCLVQVVVKVSPEEITSIKEQLLRQTDVVTLATTNQYEVFRVKYLDSLIVGYSSGKIVGSKEDARKLLLNILDKLHQNFTKTIVIGSDEAGKGEWLGPMVVAAVAVSPDREIELQAQGVMDSKELSLSKISELSELIRARNFVNDSVVITPARFNELFIQFKDENQTLNDLLAWGHSKVIDDVYSKVATNTKDIKVIIDEFDRLATEDRLRRLLTLNGIEVIQEPRAERNIAVAAASIIARDVREKYIDILSMEFKKDLRKLTVESALKDPYSFVYAKLAFLEKLAKK
jgi:ribonuclease HIII